MKYVLNSSQMKEVDDISITKYNMPSVVLMERAALSVTKIARKLVEKNKKVVCICGHGNNGADGIAIARQLYEYGYDVTILLASGSEKTSGTTEYELQKSIAKKIGINIRNKVELSEYNLIVDAIFGIGLSRCVEGLYKELIEKINLCKESKVLAVDTPSGVNSTTGEIMGSAVKADVTVTFGYAKIGLLLYPGAECAGKVKVCDIGIPKAAIEKITKKAFTFTKKDIQLIPKRKKNSNKGTYGKVLIIAGSKDMGGAACLAGLSAYRSGVGLVKIVTHENNRDAVLKSVPEALIVTYGDDCDHIESIIAEHMQWASCIVVGPGLSMCEKATAITKYVLMNTRVSTIIDADALNIVSKEKMLPMIAKKSVQNKKISLIMTPHIGEMVRLTGASKEEIIANPIQCAGDFSKRNKLICVLKDARTVVSDGNRTFINTSGNSGMSTGGSGDTLTGIIAGLISNGMNEYDAATMGVYVHGLAGDAASVSNGKYGMKAGDIIDNIGLVLKQGSERN